MKRPRTSMRDCSVSSFFSGIKACNISSSNAMGSGMNTSDESCEMLIWFILVKVVWITVESPLLVISIWSL